MIGLKGLDRAAIARGLGRLADASARRQAGRRSPTAARPSISARRRATSSSCRRRIPSWPAWPRAHAHLPATPRRACASPTCCSSRHNLSVDPYVEDIVAHAKLVVVRLLGGARYWPYGVEQVAATAARDGIALAVPARRRPARPGADATSRPCRRRRGASPLAATACKAGSRTRRKLLRYAASLIGRDAEWREPRPLLRAGLYWPGTTHARRSTTCARQWRAGRAGRRHRVLSRAGAGRRPRADRCADRGAAGARPQSAADLSSASLKEPVGRRPDRALLRRGARRTSSSTPPASRSRSPARRRRRRRSTRPTAPVLQVVLRRRHERGLARRHAAASSPRDLAMHVALPEVDGRILTRAVVVQGGRPLRRRDPMHHRRAYRPVPDRVAFVADLAASWVTPAPHAGRPSAASPSSSPTTPTATAASATASASTRPPARSKSLQRAAAGGLCDRRRSRRTAPR